MKQEANSDVSASEPTGLDTQHMFHVLQEQIQNLQCKVEVYNLTENNTNGFVKKEKLNLTMPIDYGTVVCSDNENDDLTQNTQTIEPVASANDVPNDQYYISPWAIVVEYQILRPKKKTLGKCCSGQSVVTLKNLSQILVENFCSKL